MLVKKISKKNRKKIAGFTLIEILLVIGIIAVLATVVIAALDPAKRFQDARDSRRLADIQSISSAVAQYLIDSKGRFPAGLDSTERQIGTSVDSCEISTGGCNVTGFSDCVDLTAALAPYLKTIPLEPTNGIGQDHTHYSIVLDPNNIVTVRACDAEGGELSISR